MDTSKQKYPTFEYTSISEIPAFGGTTITSLYDVVSYTTCTNDELTSVNYWTALNSGISIETGKKEFGKSSDQL